MRGKQKMNEDFVSDIPEKPVDEYTENEIREMFLDMFFWVTSNRLEWLEEAISRRKAQLLEQKMVKRK